MNKDTKQLMNEAESASLHDTPGRLQCPDCRLKMEKTEVEDFGFFLDVCANCGLTWFDPSELALFQLAFETKPQRMELNAMRERLKNMTTEERAEYERNISQIGRAHV